MMNGLGPSVRTHFLGTAVGLVRVLVALVVLVAGVVLDGAAVVVGSVEA